MKPTLMPSDRFNFLLLIHLVICWTADAFVPQQKPGNLQQRAGLLLSGSDRRCISKGTKRAAEAANSNENDDGVSIVDLFLQNENLDAEFRENEFPDDFRCGFVSIIGAPNMVSKQHVKRTGGM